jgi:hypothetical protein
MKLIQSQLERSVGLLSGPRLRHISDRWHLLGRVAFLNGLKHTAGVVVIILRPLPLRVQLIVLGGSHGAALRYVLEG